MSQRSLGAMFVALALAGCRDGATTPDAGRPSTTRVVGNCLMDPALCPSRFCLPQKDGTFQCACADVPAGQTCEPCPPGYRYHGKYSSCEPTCAVVTCPAGQACGDLFGVATCMPSDGGASDGLAADSRPPPGASCGCSVQCPLGELCLHDQPGGIGPTGSLQCSTGRGLDECRQGCSTDQPCPASRPHCLYIRMPPGCCSDTLVHGNVCCANADANDVTNCF